MSAPNLIPSDLTDMGVEHFGRRVVTVLGGNTGIVIGTGVMEAITPDEADHIARMLVLAARDVRVAAIRLNLTAGVA